MDAFPGIREAARFVQWKLKYLRVPATARRHNWYSKVMSRTLLFERDQENEQEVFTFREEGTIAGYPSVQINCVSLTSIVIVYKTPGPPIIPWEDSDVVIRGSGGRSAAKRWDIVVGGLLGLMLYHGSERYKVSDIGDLLGEKGDVNQSHAVESSGPSVSVSRWRMITQSGVQAIEKG